MDVEYQAMQIMADMAMLCDSTLKLQDKVEELQSEVFSLRTVANDQEAKILAYELAKLHVHYYIEVPSIGGGHTLGKKSTDQESKESVPAYLNWEAITDKLSSTKRRLEDNEISPDDAKKERATLCAACGGLPVDIMWVITTSRHYLARHKTRTVEQQKQLLREASKYYWP